MVSGLEDDLRLAMINLAKICGRCGYHKVAELLRVEDPSRHCRQGPLGNGRVNHKKMERRDLVRHWSEDNGRVER